jgi:hypothetical protein
MDWALAINRNRNREALLRIIAGLFALAGLANGASFVTLPRHVYRAFLRVLRPAESAVRRLIVILAHDLVVAHRAIRSAPVGLAATTGTPQNPVFPLIDPLKRFSTGTPFEPLDALPRISVPGLYDLTFTTPLSPSPDDAINAVHLSRRLAALKRALENLSTHARRLARWTFRRDFGLQNSPEKPRRITLFRPGSPPGAKLRRVHEVDDILIECHALVLDQLADTS